MGVRDLGPSKFSKKFCFLFPNSFSLSLSLKAWHCSVPPFNQFWMLYDQPNNNSILLIHFSCFTGINSGITENFFFQIQGKKFFWDPNQNHNGKRGPRAGGLEGRLQHKTYEILFALCKCTKKVYTSVSRLIFWATNVWVAKMIL